MTDDIIKPVRHKLLDEDEVHDAKHDNALNEMADVENQITELWDAVVGLRKDVESLMAIGEVHHGEPLANE
jgi:hypothetical protein